MSLTKSEKRPVSDRVGLQRGESKDTNTVRKLFGKGWNPQYHIIDGWNTESNILGKHFLSEKNSSEGVQRYAISISNWWLLVRLVEKEKLYRSSRI